MKHGKWIALFAAIGIIVFLLACAGGGGGQEKVYKMKEDATAGKAVWKVLNVETGQKFDRVEGGGGTIQAQGQFVLIEISITNKGNEQTSLTGEELEIVDDAKNTYSYDSKTNNMTLTSMGRQSLLGQGMMVAPNQMASGWILFDISKDAKGLKLKAKDIDIRSRSFVMIDLGI